ncbi:MAG: hypothetical protein LUG95_05545 [Clostridiales bacterium]|nr:hypothetical protein [Clostridiales bacterium]
MPNLAGLAELQSGLYAGQQTAVYIKSVIEPKMKIKLVTVDAFGTQETPSRLTYFVTEGHIDR